MNSLRIISILFLLASPIISQSQNSNEVTKELDKVFGPWSEKSLPGVSAGVVHKGKPIYIKGFGSANLEYGIPINSETKFQIDDLSKQFTVLALLVLEQQGKISLKDDIRTYIPKLPKYDHTIKVEHLLNQSTGLNDFVLVSSLGDSPPLSQEDAISWIGKQKQPTSKPGTSFSFYTSNTETTLMAEIVASVSGQSFSSFIQQHVFEPLGMLNTVVLDEADMIVPNLAAPYKKTENGYLKASLKGSIYGSTNVYSCANDLAKWYSYFSKSSHPMSTLIKKLDIPVHLENGETYNSSWGEMTIGRYYLHKERGVPKYWQYGLVGAYGANVFRFPQQELTSFVIGNNNQYNGSPAMQAAEPFLKDYYTEPLVVNFDKVKTKKLKTETLKKFVGDYWNAQRGIARSLVYSNDSLRISRPNDSDEIPLVPLSKTLFQMVTESDDVVKLSFDSDKSPRYYNITFGESDPELYERYTPAAYSEVELRQFSGNYYSPEIDSEYRLVVKDGKLYTQNINGDETQLYSVMEYVFRSDKVAMRSIEFNKKANGEIQGFSITTSGIRNLAFFKKG